MCVFCVRMYGGVGMRVRVHVRALGSACVKRRGGSDLFEVEIKQIRASK